MKLAHINSATVGIFSWSLLEPEENKYNFDWLDAIMDKLYQNGISVVRATPSGARPAWMAQKYPEVLRVAENGIRNEFGVRHNHCWTSPVYRQKSRAVNEKLAERYKDHPALKLWHISNEYGGECHCELCQEAFRNWLKEYYHNDLDELNESWWNGFWSHRYTDWSQINSPKDRGENHSSAMKLCWRRFVSDSAISFFENEIEPLRRITPDIPITTNFMRMCGDFDYQKFAKSLDIVSWDNYPEWDKGNTLGAAVETGFTHDVFRSLKGGKPFLMMESTPSLVNWQEVNKLPLPGRAEQAAVQAIAHGSVSVQYFQWRKSRGGHEKFHGAVVDHCGHENTRVFREVAHIGCVLEKLGGAVSERTRSRVAIVYDWENSWAVNFFCGYNNKNKNYLDVCMNWYRPFWDKGISVDIIASDDDFSPYDIVIAPFLYMLKDGVEKAVESYVEKGGVFVAGYLTGVVDKNDLCYLGGLPAGCLKEVFGIWCEETDSIPEKMKHKAEFDGKIYDVENICDIIHAVSAEVLGVYKSDFYAGMPAVTVNYYKDGKAYYSAFGADSKFINDFCGMLINEFGIPADSGIEAEKMYLSEKEGSMSL